MSQDANEDESTSSVISGSVAGSSKPSTAVGESSIDSEVHHQYPEDQKISALTKEVENMKAEAEKLRRMQAEASDVPMAPVGEDGQGHLDIEQRREIDNKSVFVGNVDFAAVPEDLQRHFSSCGTISRVTILTNKFTGQPKGYAYVEFESPTSVAAALLLNDSLFKGRMLKVTEKRTNLPGFARGRGRGRGRGGRGGRGRYRGRGGRRGGGGFKPY